MIIRRGNVTVWAAFLFISIFAVSFCSPVFADSEVIAANQAAPKYIFLFIGDGMGSLQRSIAEQYVKGVPADSRFYRPDGLIMNSLPVRGITGTRSVAKAVTDSAAAGTALACGVKTSNGMIGMDVQSRPVGNVSTVAAGRGKKIGIITSVTINHATPASFFAHDVSRGHYNAIAKQMPRSGIDFFAGGGLSWDEKKGPVETLYKSLAEAGYKLTIGKSELDALQPGQKALALYAKNGGSIPYFIDIVNGQAEKGVTLADFVAKGIELLDGPSGFFMMVEGGKIDWACHSNDAATSILETIDMDSALKVAYDFYKKHPTQTLIIVTADHETGGLKQVPAGTKTKPQSYVLAGQKNSVGKMPGKIAKLKNEKASFDRVLPIVKDAMGFNALSKAELMAMEDAWALGLSSIKKGKRKILYGSYEPVVMASMHIAARRAGLVWTSFGHSDTPVVTTAIGVGSQYFAGRYENTEIAKKLKALIMLADQKKVALQGREKKDRNQTPVLNK